jgi:hypothetical protein
MSDIAVAVVIDAAPETIWDYVAQIERHVEWMADARAIRFVDSQRSGAGTTFVCETVVGPIRLADTMTVTAWDPPVRIAVSHAGIVTGEGEFRIEPVNALSSRFRWIESLSFPWYLGGVLGERVGGRAVLASIWRRNLRALKARVEGGA